VRRSRQRPRLASPEAIDLVLDRAGEDRFARRRAPIAERIWVDAVGLRVAERAKPEKLERGVLTVKVATSAWANELSMLSSEVLTRLRALGVAASELRFRVGEVEPPARPVERREARRVPPPASIPPALGHELASIADPELRETLARAVRANLAWQANVNPKRK
jgi:hypothetical protein